MKAEVIHDELFGEVLSIPTCPLNLLSLSQLRADNWEICFDCKNDAFIITKGSNRFYFKQMRGLYKVHRGLVSINRFGTYSTHQMERIRNAHILHRNLGHPSKSVFINTLNSGTILNCSVTSSDVELMEKIMPCQACWIGNSNMHQKK
jgi:hypothetical protein